MVGPAGQQGGVSGPRNETTHPSFQGVPWALAGCLALNFSFSVLAAHRFKKRIPAVSVNLVTPNSEPVGSHCGWDIPLSGIPVETERESFRFLLRSL